MWAKMLENASAEEYIAGDIPIKPRNLFFHRNHADWCTKDDKKQNYY